MAINRFVLVLVLLILTASTVSAKEYTIKIGTELKSNIGWSTQRVDLINSSQSPITLPGGLSVSLASNYYDETTKQVWLKVTPLQSGSPDVLLKKTDRTCLKGDSGDNTLKCITDPVNATEGTIRLTLLDVIEQTTTTSTSDYVTDAASALDVYVLSSSGQKLNIKKDDIPTYDVVTYSSKTGWTSSVADQEVILKIEKKCKNPVSPITVESKGEFKKEETTDFVRYTLKSNEKYIFTTKVKMYSTWGGESEEILKYGIIVKGLAGSASSCNLLIPAPYEVRFGTSKDLTLPDGEFAALAGFTPSKLSTAEGKTSWKVGFAQSGTYTAVYTPLSCSPTIIAFNVIPTQPTPAPAITTSVKGSQSLFADDLPKTIVIIIAFILVVAAIILFLKNKKGGRGKFRENNEESGVT